MNEDHLLIHIKIFWLLALSLCMNQKAEPPAGSTLKSGAGCGRKVLTYVDTYKPTLSTKHQRLVERLQDQRSDRQMLSKDLVSLLWSLLLARVLSRSQVRNQLLKDISLLCVKMSFSKYVLIIKILKQFTMRELARPCCLNTLEVIKD